MDRRGFLQSILAAGVAPAFVGSGILMPVKALLLPARDPLWDGTVDFMGVDFGDSDFTTEWWQREGKVIAVRITKGKARYGTGGISKMEASPANGWVHLERG